LKVRVGRIKAKRVRVGRILAKGVLLGSSNKAEDHKRKYCLRGYRSS